MTESELGSIAADEGKPVRLCPLSERTPPQGTWPALLSLTEGPPVARSPHRWPSSARATTVLLRLESALTELSGVKRTLVDSCTIS